MTLRDWFAGMALSQLSAALLVQRRYRDEEGDRFELIESDYPDEPLTMETCIGISQVAYKLADAMLAEREAKDKSDA